MKSLPTISRGTRSAFGLTSVLALAMMAGCATQQPTAPLVYDAAQPGAGSGALCFDPPISRDLPAPDVAREDRVPQVVLGYEQQTVTYGDVVTWDRQFNGQDIYDRQSYQEQTSTFSR